MWISKKEKQDMWAAIKSLTEAMQLMATTIELNQQQFDITGRMMEVIGDTIFPKETKKSNKSKKK